jgi:hypothetical protein
MNSCTASRFGLAQEFNTATLRRAQNGRLAGDGATLFFAANGSLKINDGAPSVGRAAITAAAEGFMNAFPDMVVTMDSVGISGGRPVFRWSPTGTSTGDGLASSRDTRGTIPDQVGLEWLADCPGGISM